MPRQVEGPILHLAQGGEMSAARLTRSIAILIAALLCIGARPVVVGSVSRVVDGDTLVVQLSSGPIRVRLYGIDAPEHNQPGGREATDALSALLAGQRVELEPV